MTSLHMRLAILIPESFAETLNEALNLCEDDEQFNKLLNSKKTKSGEVDKRIKKNLNSMKVRYMIAFYRKSIRGEVE